MNLFLAAIALHAQSTCNNTPAYSPCEMVFELSDAAAAAHPNPYATVDLTVEFRGPRHKTYSIPGYWDGGRRMVVRFSPAEGGQWDYKLNSNIAEWDDKAGTFTAADSDAPGFVRVANVHHFAYTERNKPHLWMGVTELNFGSLDDASFRAVADARAAQKFTHLRGLVMGAGLDATFPGPDQPNLAYFQRLDARVRYLHDKGITTDLILAGGPEFLVKTFPTWQQRRRYVRFVVGRYAALNVTWQGVDYWEDYPGGRPLLKEIGGLLKEFDGYQHPRTTGAHMTSAALLDDGWENFAAYGTADDAVPAIEHQLYPVPMVSVECGREDSGAGKHGSDDIDSATFRHRLWNATMDGEYPTYANTGWGSQFVNSPGAKAMTVWYDLMSETRHWELEPYFDVDGGRALALEDVEYLVYVEKASPVEMDVAHHGYDVIWIDPADGTTVRKKYSGEHFTGEPPDKTHDWILHVVREGTLAGMNKSYYFESRDIELQEVEIDPTKLVFDLEQPSARISTSVPTPYSAKLKRATRATRSMLWLWTGEVTADHQGYRVLATGQKGTLQVPAGIAVSYPAVFLLRVFAMNANGKVYQISKGYDLAR
ncbi:MAG TPA: DUF5060 domain-containing protein [Candidatus Sulfopaludibacter sp.]|nr:DUF5060 domain-containing protein [Candidatus Sulfopaludibacter sp.]